MIVKSQLLSLLDDKEFGKGAINHDVGLMVNEHNDVLNYFIIEFKDSFEVYLELNDEGEPPYRSHLAKGSGRELDEARRNAVDKLNEIAYGNPTH